MTDNDVDGVFERFTERWPAAGDRLLSPGQDTYFAHDVKERNFRLLRGYKRAGDVLTEQALSDNYDRPSLIFPALFNYRHYIELALKDSIETHGDFAGVSLEAKDHGLPKLWQKFLGIASAFGNDPCDPAAMAVGACIDELGGFDRRSTTFRYARNLKGDVPPLPYEWIDLVRLRDVMNGIENFFECADLDFSEKSDWAAKAAFDQMHGL
jgi:hypothetical protein